MQSTLGRYEARISRQMLQYTAELERLQANRRSHEYAAAYQARKLAIEQQREAEEAAMQSEEAAEEAEAQARQLTENKPPTPQSASFRKPRSKPTDYAPTA